MYEGSKINPVSDWEEATEVEGFTLWDLHQPIRRIETTAREVTLQKRAFISEFHCPICMSILRKTKVVMSCLHRFCEECVDKCLRMNNNECPQCRAHLPSKRHLRYDTEFDAMISSVLGDVDKAEEDEMRTVKRFNRDRHKNHAFATATKKGLETQMAHRKRGPAKRIRENEVTAHAAKRPRMLPGNGRAPSESTAVQKSRLATSARKPNQKPLVKATGPESMQFILQRHPNETALPDLNRAFLRTSGKITVQVLKKYLGMKMNTDNSTKFEISLQSRDPVTKGTKLFVLRNNIAMTDAVKQYGASKDEVVLYYQLDV